MKMLYTGHVSIEEHVVYSFIYAETFSEAERYLTTLLKAYIQDYHFPPPAIFPKIQVVSRPTGWEAPDGYYLPATSKQYAMKYHFQETISTPKEIDSPRKSSFIENEWL
jgi:hypothetical protein